MSKLGSLFVAFTKEALRNKIEIFFTLFFPLIFLILFGFLFISQEDEFNKPELGLYQNGGIDIKTTIEEIDAWDIKVYDSQEELAEAVKNGEVSIGVTFDGKNLQYSYREGDLGQKSTITMAQSSITTAIEKKINEVKTVIVIERVPETAGKITATSADYTMAGVITISLLSAGMFSVISVFGRYRKRGVLKRFKITPIKPLTFVMGSTLTRFMVSFSSIFVILIVSKLLLKTSFQINWPLFLISVVSSTLGMMALGLFLTLIFKNPETAEMAATILMIMMIFLAGIYFPSAFLPPFLRVVAAFSPARYVVELLRHSLGIEFMSTTNFIVTNFVLALSGVALLYLTGKRYLKAD